MSRAAENIRLKKENEIWLYSYADLITNLLAFFLMMLAVSKQGGTAAEKIRQSISKTVAGAEVPNAVAQLLKDLKLPPGVAVQNRADGASLIFSGGVFFDSASADLTPAAKAVLDQVSAVFLKIPQEYRIDIEGFADMRPVMHNKIFPSNWELSSSRAGSVLRYLAAKGIDDRRMRAIGYGETRPVSADLQANRRVVITIGKGRL